MDLQTVSELQLKMQENGFVIIPVYDESGQGYVYSLGFTQKFDHPELIVCGLPEDLAQEVFENILAQLRIRSRFESGLVYPELFKGLNVGFLAVKPDVPERLMDGVAELLHIPPTALKVNQAIWPDPQGYLPWEPDFDERFDALQPALYDLPSDHTLQ